MFSKLSNYYSANKADIFNKDYKYPSESRKYEGNYENPDKMYMQQEIHLIGE